MSRFYFQTPNRLRDWSRLDAALEEKPIIMTGRALNAA